MKIDIIVPVYNEAQNITFLVEEIIRVQTAIQDVKFNVIFVDDGSSDNSLQVIEKIKQVRSLIIEINYISLSRNFGHQIALKAGLDFSSGDCAITMDADLQHPPGFISAMIDKWQEGYDIVQMKRVATRNQNFFKRKMSEFFYKIFNFFSSVPLEEGTSDFRLIDKKIVSILSAINERDIFWRGLIPWLGFKSAIINYNADERRFGRSKYTLKKMTMLAISGITSFSVLPLRFATFIGVFMLLFNIIYGIYIGISWIRGITIEGWTSLMFVMLLFFSFQILFLGVLGEYLGRIFLTSKHRPLYIIKDSTFKIKS